ncbi:MAG: hypothetical protein MZV64_18780, partial [Ignavibacteriales bacterium]|nr:hypothetical protein [Ignavibacteriales bacterium]
MALAGVEIPGAVLVADGRRKQTTLFFATMSEREAQRGGPAGRSTSPSSARDFTGIERVAPADQPGRRPVAAGRPGLSSSTRPASSRKLMGGEGHAAEKARGRSSSAMTFFNHLGRPPRPPELQFVRLLPRAKRFPEPPRSRTARRPSGTLRTIKSPADRDDGMRA